MLIRSLAGAACAAGLATAGLSMSASAADVGQLKPRTPLSKIPTHKIDIPRDEMGNSASTGRVLVKFHDSVQARAPMAAAVAASVSSNSGENLAAFNEIVARHGLRVRQAITKAPNSLRTLEQRAATASRKAQPDLAGMIYLEGPDDVLLVAARELNALPVVEVLEFEPQMVYHTPAPAPAPAPLPIPGEPPSCLNSDQDCFVENQAPFCGDFACCTLVGIIDPFCVNENFGAWDIICADLANLLCQDGDRCKTPITNGSCFEIHPTPGCNAEECCNLVGDVDPFCITVQWNEQCVILAGELCFGDDPGVPTPLFTMAAPDPANRWQKYATFGTVPAGDGFEQTGFTGDGLDMAKLASLGQILLDEYGVGTQNQARGKTVRVGVVEHSAYVTGPKASEGGERWHEDLEHIKVEPGQTIITISGGLLSPDHGTAALGQVNAAENDFGMTGLAPDAEGWFFPIVSVEEGGRLLSAMTSALEIFDRGDVLNFSIGPGVGTLVSNFGPWLLCRLGSDLGITSVISAGNSCFNLDDEPQFDGQDCDAIIVGACFAGRVNQNPPPQGLGRFCRLAFSNHCVQCPPESRVHISAWGHLVATTGYGDLFAPPNAAGTGPNNARAYTRTFGGTSSAAPIISGLVTCLQGLAKQFYGGSISPAGIRSIFGGQDTTIPQCEILINGSTDAEVCFGDFNPQAPLRRIGGFPQAFECGIRIIASDWFSASPVQDVKVVTGTYISGNKNSVKALDGNFFRVQTVQKAPGSQGNGFPPAIIYLIGGQTADIEVTGFTNQTPAEATAVGMRAVGLADTPFIVLGLYLYNWTQGRWTLLPGISVSQDGAFDFQAGQNVNASQYISVEGVIMGRVWTCGLGAVPQHTVSYDFIDFGVTDVPGAGPFGGGGG